MRTCAITVMKLNSLKNIWKTRLTAAHLILQTSGLTVQTDLKQCPKLTSAQQTAILRLVKQNTNIHSSDTLSAHA